MNTIREHIDTFVIGQYFEISCVTFGVKPVSLHKYQCPCTAHGVQRNACIYSKTVQ